jgi:hypothetical protein
VTYALVEEGSEIEMKNGAGSSNCGIVGLAHGNEDVDQLELDVLGQQQ